MDYWEREALIEQVGDRFFSVCDEDWDEVYRHDDHPSTVRIIDCEDSVKIDCTGENPEDSMRMANALCKLLNGNFERKEHWACMADSRENDPYKD
jgi:hypothetical protein